jgi:diacylglycerol kinase (ATP)
MKSLIILNPVSSGGRAAEMRGILENILQELNIDYHIHVSKNPSDVADTVKANIDRFTNFISFGGDGTLHGIANVLAKTDKNIGCIPVGSGNDIARNLDLPFDLKKSCIAIKNSIIKRIDLGLINKKYYYLGVSGAGFDSVVTDLANNTKFPFRGPAKYKYAVYQTLLTYRPKNFHIKFNGTSLSVDCMFAVVGNMKMYGGGMKITPGASHEDSMLDLCIIQKMSKLHFIKTFPLVFEGKHLNDPFVKSYQAESIEIDSDYNFSVYADGEYICKLPARYDVVPKALNFIVPEK